MSEIELQQHRDAIDRLAAKYELERPAVWGQPDESDPEAVIFDEGSLS